MKCFRPATLAPTSIVAVEKVRFPPKQPRSGGYKMPRKSRKSFVGHPSAILFLLIFARKSFSTSLTTPALPRMGCRAFCKLETHRSWKWHTHWVPLR